jgi:hypothetical protein
MKKSMKFERIYAAVDAVCRGEEEAFARTRLNLSTVQDRVKTLSALNSSPTSSMTLLPEIWCAHLSKAFSEIELLNRELRTLAGRVRVARLRRDKAEERLRQERTKERVQQHGQDAASQVELMLQIDRIRLR